MITKPTNSFMMLVLLGLLIFVQQLAVGIYFGVGQEIPARLEALYTFGFLCGVIWWLQSDSKRSEAQRVYCSGLFVNLVWFIVIPYHLLKTRGLKGLIPLAAWAGIYLLAVILGTIIATLLPGFYS